MAVVYSTARVGKGQYVVTGRSSDGVLRTVPIHLGSGDGVSMADCEAALDAAMEPQPEDKPARRRRVKEPQPREGSQE